MTAPAKELDVVEVVEADIVAEPLGLKEAQKLDKEIREASTKVGSAQALLVSLMADAAEGQIHLALDYRSISDYFAEAVQITPADAAERKLMAALMNGRGLSQRSIAKALGVSVGTVNNDLSDVDKQPTISTDGRNFTPQEEAADATEHHGQAKALKKAHRSVVNAAEALAEAFGDGSHFDADITPDEIKAGVKEIRAAWSDVLATFKLLADLK